MNAWEVRLAKVRVTIDVGGVPRKLFSINENARGYLALGFQAALRETVTGGKIGQQKYSIHTSADSENFTDIHHTLITKDGRTVESPLGGHLLTDAIKLKTGYAPICSRVCPDLSGSRYISPVRGFLSLGAYDPKNSTLCYVILVTYPEAPTLRFPSDKDWQIIERTFQLFKIAVVHCLHQTPSTTEGGVLHHRTVAPHLGRTPQEKLRFRNLMRGLDSGQTIEAVALHFSRLQSRTGLWP